jgi:hypothetical protein
VYRLTIAVYETSRVVQISAVFEQEQNGETERLAGARHSWPAPDAVRKLSHEDILAHLHQFVPELIARVSACLDVQMLDELDNVKSGPDGL